MNWQDCLRQVKTSLKQVKTCLVFVWKISPCCEIGMFKNWKDCLWQVETCQVL